MFPGVPFQEGERLVDGVLEGITADGEVEGQHKAADYPEERLILGFPIHQGETSIVCECVKLQTQHLKRTDLDAIHATSLRSIVPNRLIVVE